MIKKGAKKVPSMGGKAILKKYGKAHFTKLGRLSAKKRKEFAK